MRIETSAYVEIREDKIEIAVQLPDELDIDELDVLSEEVHFDVDRRPIYLVITYRKKKQFEDDP